MAFVHGRDTEITVGGDDLTEFTNTSEFTRGADVHDVTTYGKSAHVHQGGLRTGGFSMGGTYDNTANTGPAAVLEPLIGTTAEIVRKPEGTGTGKPQQTFDAVLSSYVESSPVADMVSWTAEFTVSDTVATTTQS
jgi:hypothetical protein